MTISITLLPLVVAIVGLILFFVPANAKVNDVGRIAFLCGLLSYLLTGKH